MNKHRILFLVDHKHRDLPGWSLIGYFLIQMGYEVKYEALWQEKNIIKTFNPEYIVLPKPLYEVNRLIKFKIEGRKIIVINTEGNPQDKKYKMDIKIPPDLFFCWNESQLQIEQISLKKTDAILCVVGCPRLDFYHKKMDNLFPSRDELVAKYGLYLRNKTITIATSTQDADFDDKEVEVRRNYRNRILKETADYKDIVMNMREMRSFITKAIHHFYEFYPNINIVVKPHPNENIAHWKNLVDSFSMKRVHLSLGEPINHLLIISDLHIALNVCTTTFEGKLSGVPTVEIQSDISSELYEKDHLDLPDYVVRDIDELDLIVKKILISEDYSKIQTRINIAKLQKYIDKYMYKFDGERCFEYAQKISDFIRSTNNSSNEEGIVHFFLKNYHLIRPFVESEAKKLIFKLKKFTKNSFTKKNDAAEVHDVNNSLACNISIDSRGRFDNRIKPGDEKYWFQKFDRIDGINKYEKPK
jgi:surface carbohydrate biosynthesis protein